MKKSPIVIALNLALGLIALGCDFTNLYAAEITPSTFLKRVPPVYPKQRVRAGEAGAVELSFMLDKQGQPFEIVAVRSSHPDFEPSARSALRKYKFQSAKQYGEPVDSRSKVVIFYEIEGQRNRLTRPFYKWMGDINPLLVSDEPDGASLIQALKRGNRRAKSRCDFAWLALLQSHYSLSFESSKEKVEALRLALMFDYDVEEDYRCYKDAQKSALFGSLIKELIAAKAKAALSELSESSLTQLEQGILAKFSVEIDALLAEKTSSTIVNAEDLNLNQRYNLIPFPTERFSLNVPDNLVQSVSLRCANGYRKWSENLVREYSIPNDFEQCQLLFVLK